MAPAASQGLAKDGARRAGSVRFYLALKVCVAPTPRFAPLPGPRSGFWGGCWTPERTPRLTTPSAHPYSMDASRDDLLCWNDPISLKLLEKSGWRGYAQPFPLARRSGIVRGQPWSGAALGGFRLLRGDAGGGTEGRRGFQTIPVKSRGNFPGFNPSAS